MYEFLRRDAKVAVSYRLQFFFQIASVLSVSITFFFLSFMLRQVEGGIRSLEGYGGRYFGFVPSGSRSPATSTRRSGCSPRRCARPR